MARRISPPANSPISAIDRIAHRLTTPWSFELMEAKEKDCGEKTSRQHVLIGDARWRAERSRCAPPPTEPGHRRSAPQGPHTNPRQTETKGVRVIERILGEPCVGRDAEPFWHPLVDEFGRFLLTIGRCLEPGDEYGQIDRGGLPGLVRGADRLVWSLTEISSKLAVNQPRAECGILSRTDRPRNLTSGQRAGEGSRTPAYGHECVTTELPAEA